MTAYLSFIKMEERVIDYFANSNYKEKNTNQISRYQARNAKLHFE